MPIEDRLLQLTWTLAAWDDYEYWQGQDRKTLKRINALVKDCLRHPFEGIGKPEPLKENLSGFWSRRIDDTQSSLKYSFQATSSRFDAGCASIGRNLAGHPA